MNKFRKRKKMHATNSFENLNAKQFHISKFLFITYYDILISSKYILRYYNEIRIIDNDIC